MSEVLLDINDLRVRYGSIEVIHGLDLSVEAARVTALLGANGAGKSTTMRTVVGQRSMSGRVTFAGDDISSWPAHKIARRGIALVPEGRMVFASLSVQGNLRMGSYGTKRRWRSAEKLDEVLALFPELVPMLNRRAGLLSGGQQQMVAVGRALMAEPSLLLLDEPSMGLAPLVVQRIYDALGRLKAQGTAILLAEQNARMALDLADDVYVLQSGTVMERGTADELRASPRIQEIYLGSAAG